jgi:hypothetical protein
VTTIGFIGSGKIGSQLARLAVAQGHDVVLSNSREPETLAELVAELGPHARAATPAEAATAADIAVVTIPLRAIDTVPVAPLAGKDRDRHQQLLSRSATGRSWSSTPKAPLSRSCCSGTCPARRWSIPGHVTVRANGTSTGIWCTEWLQKDTEWCW